MKTLEDLTPEILAKIPLYKEKCVKELYNGTEYANWKREYTVDYIEYIYKLCDKSKPVVIIANNIEEYKRLYNLLFNDKLNEEYTKLVNYLYELKNNLIKPKDDKDDAYLENDLCERIKHDLSNFTGSDMEKILVENYITPQQHWLFLCSEYSRVYLMWYYFLHKEFDIELSEHLETLTWLYENVNKANIAKAFFCERVCLVLRMPSKIIRNEVGFHSVDEGAIQYPNLNMYYVNNVRLTEELFNKLSKKEYTFEDFVSEPNEEIKAACLEFYRQKFGDEYMFNFISKNMKEVDTYVDKKEDKYLEGTTKGMNIGVYTLFKGSVNNFDVAYVRCYCFSTERVFFLSVLPTYTNAKEAMGSLLHLPKILIPHLQSIRRQGEIYSTTYSSEGTVLLKNISKEDLRDTAALSGDAYFNLMEFEY